MRVLVASREGLHPFDERGAAGPVQLEGRVVTSLAPHGRELWAAVDGSQLWHASDKEWNHVADLPGLRIASIATTDADVFVGSSEARLFRVVGDRLETVAAFDRADGRSSWYTPWGGPPETRSLSEWDDDLYVNVHVGGIQRTDDRGEHWTPTINIDADVHQVATAEGLVLAACAGGLAVSDDRGTTWTLRADGLEAPYARAVTVCGDVVLVSASRGPRGGRSAVYRGTVASGGFERCRDGLPEWFDDNIDSSCLDALPDGSFAAFGTSNGQLFGSSDAGSSWTELASGLPVVRRVLVLP
ncbi:MAG: hypothetical protein M3P43_02005 [Actinomycetota bacterium]|nr:hypothetical protein [Actinomycetota bacterium]